MTTKVYTETILPAILDDFTSQGLTLCQDTDSAHISRGTAAWVKQHGLSLLTLPGVSPDLSILETEAHPIKRKFHSRRCTTEKAAMARFEQVFIEELDQNTIQNLYDFYTLRLWDCRRVEGQMTKF
jgi:hypothetical protein